MSELAVHRLDLVIADAPIPQSVSVRAFSHRLGESGISFFAREDLANSLVGRFPAMLDGAPTLLPGEDAAIRGASTDGSCGLPSALLFAATSTTAP